MPKSKNHSYENPLSARYASEAMQAVFSPQYKFSAWRKLWLALAEAEAELGLDIRPAQLRQMRANLENIDLKRAAQYEKKFRHDVMAHVHAFGDVAPAAAGIIHLGATSAFVGDNTDLIQIRAAMELVRARLAHVIERLADFARAHKKLPTLGYTHFQPAQLTTVGKRATLWCYEFVQDIEDVQYRLDTLTFRSAKGTTGTQASFLKLFGGDHRKVQQLDRMVAKKMGFDRVAPVTGQTYSRKIDANILAVLSGVAQSTHKFCNDVRLLAHLKQIEEPFEKDQIGSSAMAYKRNPMRCERATSLARFVMSLADSPAMTAAEQWFERTLDDSANKRLTIPQAFLAVDAILILLTNVTSGLVVYPEVIEAAIQAELPFIATENILMAAVAAGGDRQKLHERIRRHSHAAGAEVKEKGRPNDLIARLKKDQAFSGVDLANLMQSRLYVGRSPQQVDEFLKDVIAPLKRKFKKYADVKTVELKV